MPKMYAFILDLYVLVFVFFTTLFDMMLVYSSGPIKNKELLYGIELYLEYQSVQ